MPLLAPRHRRLTDAGRPSLGRVTARDEGSANPTAVVVGRPATAATTAAAQALLRQSPGAPHVLVGRKFSSRSRPGPQRRHTGVGGDRGQRRPPRPSSPGTVEPVTTVLVTAMVLVAVMFVVVFATLALAARAPRRRQLDDARAQARLWVERLGSELLVLDGA